ncbi:hypothetical protein POTOM_057702 [Populus tomentosa]|uniref:Uncharacterized protein n=1 Tax=Populus tomentosa TaxID=118781 RepID=A0A8X7XTP0_POPTO|nr:hypothetical protein POTOM_057702 [Populus tomentosa]
MSSILMILQFQLRRTIHFLKTRMKVMLLAPMMPPIVCNGAEYSHPLCFGRSTTVSSASESSALNFVYGRRKINSVTFLSGHAPAMPKRSGDECLSSDDPSAASFEAERVHSSGIFMIDNERLWIPFCRESMFNVVEEQKVVIDSLWNRNCRDVDAVGGPVVLDPSYLVSLTVDLLVF